MTTFTVPDLAAKPRAPRIDETPGAAFDALLKKHKISKDEYAVIRGITKAPPTLAELGTFSAMWSEHCSYKSSRVHLKRFPTTGPAVVVGPGENAGVVRLSGKLCLAFKMESHNHPSYIEPYQGAATGVGGILRDVFCMGARPIANLNALRFGKRDHPKTSHLVENCVKGIGDYGNCIGVPTVAGNISFDESYNGNCLVNAMTVGVIHEDRIFKGYATGTGNLVVYVGSATGRDGIHGASMASDSFAAATSGERSTVQVGDPFMEKLLLEATLEVLDQGLVVGLQDMGAAGLTSSSFEMAGRAGNGLFMDLDRVPTRTTAMTAYELLLSESQERMLMVVEPKNWDKLKVVLDRWQLHSAVIGVVTGTGRVQALHKGVLEIDLPVDPMTDAAPKYSRPMKPRPAISAADSAAFIRRVSDAVRAAGPEEMLRMCVADTGAKTKIIDQYDQHIGVRTVRGPSSHGAAVLWPRSEWADPNEPHVGVAIAASCNERYCRAQPRLGAAQAVLKAARAIAATGAKPLAITDCLNFGNPEDPEVMWEFSEAVDGISDACKALGAPVVSGNVSLYNTTDGVSIAPTPMIGIVGKVRDVRTSPPAVVSRATTLFLLHGKASKPTFGGSLAAKLMDFEPRGGEIPEIRWDAEVEAMDFLRTLIEAGHVTAARDVGDGGLATAAAKLVLPTAGLGLRLDLTKAEIADENAVLRYFGEISGAYLVALKDESRRAVQDLAFGLKRNAFVEVGTSTAGDRLELGGWTVSRAQLEAASRGSMPF